MKHLLPVILIAMFFSQTAICQNWQVGLIYRYGFGAPEQRYDHIYEMVRFDNHPEQYRMPFSFGTGNSIGLEGGYTFKNRIALLLGVNYFKSHEINQTVVHENNTLNEFTFSAKMLYLKPTFAYSYKAHRWWKFYPNLNVSGILASGRIDNSVYASSPLSNGNTFSVETEAVAKGHVGFGAALGLGATYEISKYLHLSIMFDYMHLTYAPSSSEITRLYYVEALVDYTERLTPQERRIKYYPKDEVPEQKEDEALVMEYQYAPFSSFGASIKIVYVFGK